MLVPLLVLLAVAVAFGIWRRFGPIQWIWLLFGTAIALVLLWFIVLTFLIGPEMRRQGPPGQPRGMPVGATDVRMDGAPEPGAHAATGTLAAGRACGVTARA